VRARERENESAHERREREGERVRESEREGEREVFAMVNCFFTSQIYYLYVPGSFKHL